MSNDQWEDLCLDCGRWQWIDSEAVGRNEFQETLGLKRLKEALEANEWDGGDLDAGEIDLEVDLGLRERDNSSDDIELEREDDLGSREAILEQHALVEEGTEGDAQVEELESMMLKMQAIKGLFRCLLLLHRSKHQLTPFAPIAEKGIGMPEDDRKRLAAKAVRDIMKSI